jgi:hypothetical protein
MDNKKKISTFRTWVIPMSFLYNWKDTFNIILPELSCTCCMIASEKEGIQVEYGIFIHYRHHWDRLSF